MALGFALDTKAPAVNERLGNDTGSSATDRITRDPTLAGGGDGAAVVTLTEGAAVLGTVTAAANGNWVYTPTLVDGAHTIVASETDTAGNVGTASLTFTLDTTAPAVTEALLSDTGASAADKLTNKSVLTGGGDANAAVRFTIDGAVVAAGTTASTTGAWTYTPAGLADGVHTVIAKELDAAGNFGTASLVFTLDTVAPAVTEALVQDTGASPTDRTTSNAALRGTGDANALVILDRGCDHARHGDCRRHRSLDLYPEPRRRRAQRHRDGDGRRRQHRQGDPRFHARYQAPAGQRVSGHRHRIERQRWDHP